MMGSMQQDYSAILTGEHRDSLVNKGSDGVQVLGVEVSEDLAQVSAGEASGGGEGHGRVVSGAELEVEGGNESVDERSLEGESAGDDGEEEGEQLGEQRGDELGQDDGGEDHNEDGDEVGELAEVEPVLLSGGISSLLEPVVVGGAGGGVAGGGGWLGVGGVVSSIWDPVLGLATVSRHTEDQADRQEERRYRETHLQHSDISTGPGGTPSRTLAKSSLCVSLWVCIVDNNPMSASFSIVYRHHKPLQATPSVHYGGARENDGNLLVSLLPLSSTTSNPMLLCVSWKRIKGHLHFIFIGGANSVSLRVPYNGLGS